jgi:hypothetical protein
MLQFYKIELQVHENTTSIKITILSSLQRPMCVDMVSTFHYLVIIYQSFNVKYFGNFEKPTNLEHIFHPFKQPTRYKMPSMIRKE